MSSDSPNFIETIICLADSRKKSGYCVAGKRTNDGSWLRPVSHRLGHEISELDRTYSDGSTVQLLDIIEIPCIEAHPNRYQNENVLIDDRFYWTKKGRASWDDVFGLVEPAADLWANGYSAYYNLNNRLPEQLLEKYQGSLRLIKLDEMVFHVGPKAPDFGDMRLIVRASFKYRGQHYKLDVTDPDCENQCLEQGPGEYVLNSVIACISMSELHTNQNGDTFAYKLVASVMTKESVAA